MPMKQAEHSPHLDPFSLGPALQQPRHVLSLGRRFFPRHVHLKCQQTTQYIISTLIPLALGLPSSSHAMCFALSASAVNSSVTVYVRREIVQYRASI